ncbi:MAG: hypothetical protein O3C40_08200 [Planctomycetota bacterium]|nr:hypothetical protein [Planctomycetota bacterium]
MHYRYHGGSKRNASGKWEHVPHTGIGHVACEEIGDWTVELSHRQVGVTIKRDQFSVTIRRESPAHEELLSGFSSKVAAMEAARKRVDLLSHMREPTVRAPHRRRATDVRRGS